MTETQAIGPAMPGNRILKFTAFLFGAVAYLTFLITILYAIGFVSGLVVPKDIDTGAKSPVFEAIIVNLVLMSLFAIQHSVMARKSFKQWWTQFIPRPIERSTYVLCASLTLLLLFWQWRPMPAAIWSVEEPGIAAAIAALSFIGVGINPPTPSWGQMVGENQQFLRSYWYLCVFPSIAIAVTMLSFTFFGDGVRDALDPKMK